MFDWEASIEEEAEGIKMYEKAAEEMKKKYPNKLYVLQFEMMAKEEANHKRILEKMMKEIEK